MSDDWEVEGMISVGNSGTLHESALVEAFNLKAAYEFDLGKCNLLRKALSFYAFANTLKIFEH